MTYTFDLEQLVFSLVFVRPKTRFLEWLQTTAAGRGMSLDDVYFKEENGVWLIPAIGTFDDQQSFDAYLLKIKSSIAADEFGKYGPDAGDVPDFRDIGAIDLYFDFEVRDRAMIAPMEDRDAHK
jgi:hypothetical protein